MDPFDTDFRLARKPEGSEINANLAHELGGRKLNILQSKVLCLLQAEEFLALGIAQAPNLT